jgi:putative pyruvate formate lyase activating enzyme
VVWNSNSYYSEKTAEILKGVVDIYLLDFRYFDERCSVKLSSAPRYAEAARRNFLEAAKDSELLIRLLVIPGHTECDAKPILKWIRDNMGAWTRVNIMGQYFPTWQADLFPEINRRLNREEYGDVVDYAVEIGLKNFIVQEHYLR